MDQKINEKIRREKNIQNMLKTTFPGKQKVPKEKEVEVMRPTIK